MTVQQSNYSGSRYARIETVELSDGVTTLRYALAHDDIIAGGMAFTALDMDPDSLADPSQDGDGAQEITLTLDNVDGRLTVFAYNLNRAKTSATVTRRTFDESDLSTPVSEYQMTIKSASWTIMSVSFVCGYMSIFELAWPRRTYNLNDFPGIRYL